MEDLDSGRRLCQEPHAPWTVIQVIQGGAHHAAQYVELGYKVMSRKSTILASFRETWLAASLLLLGVNSCAPEQSTLVISVAGLQPDIKTLHLTARLAGTESTRDYVAASTIGLKLPAGASGQVELRMNGLGGNGCPVATGQASVAASMQERVDVALQLVAQTCSTNHLQLVCANGQCDGLCASGYSDCDGNKQTNGCETLGACSLGFGPAQSFNVDPEPNSIAVADFNSDAKSDIAIVHQKSDRVSVLLGNGLGGFGGVKILQVSTTFAPHAVGAGDLNGDRKPDLVVANLGAHSVSILLADSMNGFGMPTNVLADTNPASIVLADFNADQAIDLAVTNFGANNVSIMLGDGNGVLKPQLSLPAVGTNPAAIAAADFDGDKKLDLAVANNGSDNVSVLIGKGDGGFIVQPTPLRVGTQPTSIVSGDFNGDQKQDLAVSNGGSNNVSVLFGDGTGRFGTALNFATGASPVGLTVGDFNSDQRPDLAVANYKAASVSVLLGTVAGTFAPASTFPVGGGPIALAMGDFNNDGWPDLVSTNSGNASVSVLLNQSR